MKNSFTLIFTLAFIFLFSLIALRIYELKALSSTNGVNQYIYLQAKNHLSFLEEYIKSKKSLELLKKIEIENEKYEILGLIKKISNNKFQINLSVKAKNYKIRVHKVLEIIR